MPHRSFFLARCAVFSSILCLGNVAFADEAPGTSLPTVEKAEIAAAADGLSTIAGIQTGMAYEANSIAPSSPAGIFLFTLMKIGMVRWADRQPAHIREPMLRTSTAVWGGAAANNLLITAGASSAGAVGGGVLVGIWLWNHVDQSLKAERKTGKKPPFQPKAAQPVAMPGVPLDPFYLYGN